MERYQLFPVFLAVTTLTACGESSRGGGTGVPDTGMGLGSDGAGSGVTGDDPEDPNERFDLGETPPPEPEPEDDAEEELDFSYIWIANSEQSTVSKINTRTLVEEGRYVTRADEDGNPSRTSVNVVGDVAVANRHGGITKFYATASRCKDANGDGVRTSSGPDDVLAWDDEDCRAWFTPMDYRSQRAIAWTRAEVIDLPDGGRTVGPQFLWVTGVPTEPTHVDVHLLDGATGEPLEMVRLSPEVLGKDYLNRTNVAYGGAVDGESNFWFHAYEGDGPLVRIDREDFSYRIYEKPVGSGYGIAVDPEGYVWSCSHTIQRFDPSTESWQQVDLADGNRGGHAGCMPDAQGRLWLISSNNSLLGFDYKTFDLVAKYTMPPGIMKGISIDFDGYVWAVSLDGDIGALRVDPETGNYDAVAGLVFPYTYSDMTGFALQSAGFKPIP